MHFPNTIDYGRASSTVEEKTQQQQTVIWSVCLFLFLFFLYFILFSYLFFYFFLFFANVGISPSLNEAHADENISRNTTLSPLFRDKSGCD